MFIETDFHRDESGIDLPDQVIFEIIEHEIELARRNGTPASTYVYGNGKNLVMRRLRKLRKQFLKEYDFQGYILKHYRDEYQDQDATDQREKDAE